VMARANADHTPDNSYTFARSAHKSQPRSETDKLSSQVGYITLTRLGLADNGKNGLSPSVLRWLRCPFSLTNEHASGSQELTRVRKSKCGSESDFRAELNLPRVEDVASRAEPESGRRRRAGIIRAPPLRVVVLHVYPVQQVEHVERHFDPAAAGGELARDAEVDARIRRTVIRVPLEKRRPIGVGVAVKIEIAAGKDVERPPAFQRYQRAHLHALRRAGRRRQLAQDRQRESMPDILP